MVSDGEASAGKARPSAVLSGVRDRVSDVASKGRLAALAHVPVRSGVKRRRRHRESTQSSEVSPSGALTTLTGAARI